MMKKNFVSAVLILAMVAMTGCGANQSQEAVTEDTQVVGTTEENVEMSETGTIVKTTAYGQVSGVNAGSYEAWYGIPYAKAPVDDLRWEAPVDPDSWSEVLNCTEPGNIAIQCGTDYATGETVVSGSEDCLNLDVYSKEGADNLPVLVFIHGGNNQTGKSSEIEGSEIVVDENCVYVSLNYRLGILGFNCLPAFQKDENATGNYAMLDIAKALDWVKVNIAEFGGDPNNITISGFSAGGRDVMAMLISPMFEGKFDKAVVFSGGMTVADETASQSQIAWAVAPLVVEDGVKASEEEAHDWLLTDGDDVVEYMNTVSGERLCALMANAGIRMSVFPHLYGDDVVIPSEGFATTKYNSVPVLMLTGSTEFSLFSAFDGFYFSPTIQELPEEEQNAVKAFAINYGSDMYRIFNAQCSAETMYDNYDADIYLCQVEYGSANSETVSPMMGSFHGVFVPMLTKTHGYGDFGDFTTEGFLSMASMFDGYLTNFLATGNPNGDGLTEWANWTPDNKVSMVLDANETEGKAELKDVSTSYDEIIKAMEADDTISEELKMANIKAVMNGRWFSDSLDKHYNNESLWK